MFEDFCRAEVDDLVRLGLHVDSRGLLHKVVEVPLRIGIVMRPSHMPDAAVGTEAPARRDELRRRGLVLLDRESAAESLRRSEVRGKRRDQDDGQLQKASAVHVDDAEYHGGKTLDYDDEGC